MSENKVLPLEAIQFVMNPSPRLPCVLLLDTSESMMGAKMKGLNEALRTFSESLRKSHAKLGVEIAVVGFGPARIISPFTTADEFYPPILTTSKSRPMGAAVRMGISMVEARKALFKKWGIGYFKPWIFMIANGTSADEVSTAAALVHKSEVEKKLAFYAVGVDQADMKALSLLSAQRPPLMLRGCQFNRLFDWLSYALISVAIGPYPVTLPDPLGPNGWAEKV